MGNIALVNSQLNTQAVDILKNRGYECIALPNADFLPFPMSTHPDMLVFVGWGKLFTHVKYYEKNKKLIDDITNKSSLSLVISHEDIEYKYPNDVLFNAALVGNKLICNPKYLSRHILEEAQKNGCELVCVSQGYSKCSTCIVSGNAVITSDKGIHKAAILCGIDSLLIKPGHISLPPYEYGFIGGASGNDENCVYFCGDINKHPDCDVIREFIESKNINTVCLYNGTLFDSGSILFL